MTEGSVGTTANGSGKSHYETAGQATSDHNVFERRYRLYAFLREHVFRDHTEEISRSIFPTDGPRPGQRVLELGCGPGFYTRRLAKRFPQIETIGIDRSVSLVEFARSRAKAAALENCSFQQGDACALLDIPGQVDAIVVSRLFLIVWDREAVLSEIFRLLKPGGRCFLAEPTTRFKTRLPMWAMLLAGRVTHESHPIRTGLFDSRVMSHQDFHCLLHSQPWRHIEMTARNGYQYAVCVKGAL
jgi:ubiquinone/menaquinone biosynthesis C-methylase UbiE